MKRANILSAAIKAKLILPRSNCVDGAVAYSDGDLQDALYELVALVEKETLERAAKVCRDKAMKMELEAQSAEAEGDEDTCQSNRASAWLLHVAGGDIANLKDDHGQD